MSTEMARLNCELKGFLKKISEGRNKNLTQLGPEDLKEILKESLEKRSQEKQEKTETIPLEELENKFVKEEDIEPILKQIMKIVVGLMIEIFPREEYVKKIREERINQEYLPESLRRKLNPKNFLNKNPA